MKKVLLSILAIIYFANISGASLQLHYCMGKLVSIGMIPESRKQCSHCGMAKSASDAKHCCKDEAKKVSADKDTKATLASVQYLKSPAGVVTFIQHSLEVSPLVSVRKTGMPLANAPPVSEPLYLLFGVFRI